MIVMAFSSLSTEVVEERVDERTGLSTKVVIDTKDIEKRPRISMKGPDGNTLKLPNGNEARYQLPVGIHLNVYDGQVVGPGDIIAKMPRETGSECVMKTSSFDHPCDALTSPSVCSISGRCWCVNGL